ncbi:hypothetical protein PMAC_000409 [Pneumocystis sp. 'macacae']|nr:hypothetical protein PMAC_000409 [Pneumocystis sp. 'macacae']
MTNNVEVHKEESRNLFQESIEYDQDTLVFPTNNPAFSFLELPEEILYIKKLSGIIKLQKQSTFFHETYIGKDSKIHTFLDPPSCFISNSTYNIFQCKILTIRTLTHQNALKKVIHFDLDTKKYPFSEDENWVVGGFIGICVPNLKNSVDEIFKLLNISEEEANKEIIFETQNNQWSTFWSNISSQKFKTTQRNIMTWMVDIQSIPPKKALLRLLAEYATNPLDRKVLFFLCSKEGKDLIS